MAPRKAKVIDSKQKKLTDMVLTPRSNVNIKSYTLNKSNPNNAENQPSEQLMAFPNDFPVDLSTFYTYTNIMDLTIEFIQMKRPKSYETRINNPKYLKKIADQLYASYYTIPSCRGSRPLNNLTVTVNCPKKIAKKIFLMHNKYKSNTKLVLMASNHKLGKAVREDNLSTKAKNKPAEIVDDLLNPQPSTSKKALERLQETRKIYERMQTIELPSDDDSLHSVQCQRKRTLPFNELNTDEDSDCGIVYMRTPSPVISPLTVFTKSPNKALRNLLPVYHEMEHLPGPANFALPLPTKLKKTSLNRIQPACNEVQHLPKAAFSVLPQATYSPDRFLRGLSLVPNDIQQSPKAFNSSLPRAIIFPEIVDLDLSPDPIDIQQLPKAVNTSLPQATKSQERVARVPSPVLIDIQQSSKAINTSLPQATKSQERVPRVPSPVSIDIQNSPKAVITWLPQAANSPERVVRHTSPFYQAISDEEIISPLRRNKRTHEKAFNTTSEKSLHNESFSTTTVNKIHKNNVHNCFEEVLKSISTKVNIDESLLPVPFGYFIKHTNLLKLIKQELINLHPNLYEVKKNNIKLTTEIAYRLFFLYYTQHQCRTHGFFLNLMIRACDAERLNEIPQYQSVKSSGNEVIINDKNSNTIGSSLVELPADKNVNTIQEGNIIAIEPAGKDNSQTKNNLESDQTECTEQIEYVEKHPPVCIGETELVNDIPLCSDQAETLSSMPTSEIENNSGLRAQVTEKRPFTCIEEICESSDQCSDENEKNPILCTEGTEIDVTQYSIETENRSPRCTEETETQILYWNTRESFLRNYKELKLVESLLPITLKFFKKSIHLNKTIILILTEISKDDQEFQKSVESSTICDLVIMNYYLGYYLDDNTQTVFPLCLKLFPNHIKQKIHTRLSSIKQKELMQKLKGGIIEYSESTSNKEINVTKIDNHDTQCATENPKLEHNMFFKPIKNLKLYESQLPVTISEFIKSSYYTELVLSIIKAIANGNNDVYQKLIQNRTVINRIKVNYYIMFYLYPEIRHKYPLKLRDIPDHIAKKILIFTDKQYEDFNQLCENIDPQSKDTETVESPKTVQNHENAQNLENPTENENVHVIPITCEKFPTKVISENVEKQSTNKEMNPPNLTKRILLPKTDDIPHTFLMRYLKLRIPDKSEREKMVDYIKSNSFKSLEQRNIEVDAVEREMELIHAECSSNQNINGTLNRLTKVDKIYYKKWPPVHRFSNMLASTTGLNYHIMNAVSKMSFEEFQKFTHIHQAPEVYENEKKLQKYYNFVFHKQHIWPQNLYMNLKDLMSFLNSKKIAVRRISLKNISPKILHWEELSTSTYFDKWVQMYYDNEFGQQNMLSEMDEKRIKYYHLCWEQNKWIIEPPQSRRKSLLEQITDSMYDIGKVNDFKTPLTPTSTERPPQNVRIISALITEAAHDQNSTNSNILNTDENPTIRTQNTSQFNISTNANTTTIENTISHQRNYQTSSPNLFPSSGSSGLTNQTDENLSGNISGNYIEMPNTQDQLRSLQLENQSIWTDPLISQQGTSKLESSRNICEIKSPTVIVKDIQVKQEKKMLDKLQFHLDETNNIIYCENLPDEPILITDESQDIPGSNECNSDPQSDYNYNELSAAIPQSERYIEINNFQTYQTNVINEVSLETKQDLLHIASDNNIMSRPVNLIQNTNVNTLGTDSVNFMTYIPKSTAQLVSRNLENQLIHPIRALPNSYITIRQKTSKKTKNPPSISP